MKRMMVASAAVAAVVALSACGGGESTPRSSANASSSAATTESLPSVVALVARANDAAQNAETVRIHIHIAGEQGESRVVVAGRVDGTNQWFSRNLAGEEVEVVTVDGRDYYRGNDKFWISNGVAEERAIQLRGKWVANDERSLSKRWNVNLLLEQAAKFATYYTASPDYATVAEDVIDGVPAYKITNRMNDLTLWVEKGGKNRYLRLSGTKDLSDNPSGIGGAGSKLEQSFADWDAVEPVSAPPAGEIVG